MREHSEIDRKIEQLYDELDKYPSGSEAYNRIRGKIAALEWVLEEIDEL